MACSSDSDVSPLTASVQPAGVQGSYPGWSVFENHGVEISKRNHSAASGFGLFLRCKKLRLLEVARIGT
jgi:hypothetical protein